MNHIKIIGNSLAVVLALGLSPAMAEGSWWRKSADLFKSLDPQTVSTVSEMAGGAVNVDEIAEAFKQALKIGSENIVAQLGGVDGFNGDEAVHIPLPAQLAQVRELLAKVGMGGLTDDLETRLNLAAEAATPQAKELFLKVITEMSFDDVKTIYSGPEDAATRYFQQKMSLELGRQMQPIVADSLSQVGAVQALDSVMSKYQALPLVPDVKADLTDHVVQKGMGGIFYYLAQEEAQIRQNPVKQSTELLKKVFGAS